RVEAEVGDAAAAMTLGDAQAQEALRARLQPELAVDPPLLADLLAARHQLPIDEGGHGLPEPVVLVFEECAWEEVHDAGGVSKRLLTIYNATRGRRSLGGGPRGRGARAVARRARSV